MRASSFDPRVDAYINRSAPFAQPILEHVRELVHKTVPDIEESIKWSMPFFTYKGQMFGNLAAFKAHCSFGLFGGTMKAWFKEQGTDNEGMGSLGKLTGVKDLPPNKVLIGYIRQAAAFIDDGAKTMQRPRKAARPAPEVPADLAAALKKNKAAQRVWASFSASCQREYADWITEAKRAETREKRVAQAVEWIAEGKQRNWKYQNRQGGESEIR
ncbi:MAG: YdeI/OmpD-associated family protein [Acidobacteria bacterium]|nr:YdeI/OmpD-associated family protein [Acidobacteriota bacterium]